MSNEIELKTSEDLDLELKVFLSNLGCEVSSERMKNFLEQEKISKEDVELMASEIFNGSRFEDRSAAAFEMIICDRIMKILKHRISEAEIELLNTGNVTTMVGTTEFVVNVFAGGVKKQVQSQDLRWKFIERENSLADGLKKTKKGSKNDE